MKKTSIFICLLLAVLFVVSTTHAALVDNGDGTITQTRSDGSQLMWLKDANYGGNDIWMDAMTWADSLVFADYDDWRLPSALNSDGSGPCRGWFCTDSEMGYLHFQELENVLFFSGCTFGIDCGLVNTGPFENIQTNEHYWFADEDVSTNPNSTYVFTFFNGNQTTENQNSVSLNVWAVRDVTVVPEPISSTLFIVGGATIGFRRFRKKFMK